MKSKILIGAAFYNESGNITKLLERFRELKIDLPFSFVFVDDASTDDTKEFVKNFFAKSKMKNVELLENQKNSGIGFNIRKIIQYGITHKYDIYVIMAGNGKDNPLEIPKLLAPILKDNYDYVQGSRFLEGGSFKNLPLPRQVLIRGFTLIMQIFTSKKCTDTSNGFRAYKLSIFANKKININQSWLDRYELETYLHYKVLTLGYRVKEVAVSKDYLPHVKNYSKMRPFIDWWRMARPIFLLKFGIRN